ncbi:MULTISPECIES: lipocalin/fatty-acid binding family protein [unclassified Streptomyces]|uniref:lipocalin/fatty-acid binding family protein n=1 Tax=unclassified Streptomyces TaxID=2593676 RepID=UPI0013A6E90B|nr:MULTISPECIES: lipocalin/fatty-acid binding family protein [unclassified Streptomyces]
MGIAGTYEMTSSDNYEDYLKATGVGMATRKLAASSKPTVTITEDGDNYRMKTVTTFKTIDLAFKIGEEFVEETDDGRKANTTITRDGDKLVQVQKLDTLSTRITRTFIDNGLIAVFAVGDVVSNRSYKRI